MISKRDKRPKKIKTIYMDYGLLMWDPKRSAKYDGYCRSITPESFDLFDIRMITHLINKKYIPKRKS
jgi:hypothetical protein